MHHLRPCAPSKAVKGIHRHKKQDSHHAHASFNKLTKPESCQDYVTNIIGEAHHAEYLSFNMIFTTERKKAEEETNTIKKAVLDSKLNFLISESAFSLHLSLKKSFLNDNSKQIYQKEKEASPNPLSFGPLSSTAFSSFSSSTSYPTDRDSGFNVSENISEIQTLKSEISGKHYEISSLNSELLTMSNKIKVANKMLQKVTF